MNNRVIGIDIGTSSCSVALFENGAPRVLPVFNGRDEMPTYVAFNSDGSSLVGLAAKNQAVINPVNTIFTVKRLIGRKYADAATGGELGLLPYRVTSSTDGTLWIDALGRAFTPTEITAIMLREVKRATEAYLGHSVCQAVITVPARFDKSQIRATVDAAEIAGIEVLRTVTEPVAAALAYGFAQGSLQAEVAVYDLGGGTFDVSILEISDGVYEVLALNGDNRLGGEDFDHLLVDFFINQIRDEHGVDLSSNALALHRIKDAAERIKIELDSRVAVTVPLPYITISAEKMFNAELRITRTQLESLFQPLIDRTLLPCEHAARDSCKSIPPVGRLILVGGMSRMPAIRARVAEYFRTTPRQQMDPSRIVALGAAIYAGVLEGHVKDQLLLDVTPLSLSLVGEGFEPIAIISRNCTFPTRTEVWLGVHDVNCSVNLTPAQWAAFARKGKIRILEGEHESQLQNLVLFDGNIDFGIDLNATGPLLGVQINIDANLTATLEIRRLTDGVVVLDAHRLDASNPFGQSRQFSEEEVATAREQADTLINAVDAAIANGELGREPSVLAALGGARSDLVRAMQSRDMTALRQALALLSERAQRTAGRIPAQLPPPFALRSEARSGPSIFISYARADRRWLDRLLVHLAPLVRAHQVTVWHDGKIEPGDAWQREIEEELATASAVILLVSANFLASDFIYLNELPPILERHARGGLRVIPLVVSNSQFELDPKLSALGAFNDPKLPLSAMRRPAAEKELERLAASLWRELSS